MTPQKVDANFIDSLKQQISEAQSGADPKTKEKLGKILTGLEMKKLALENPVNPNPSNAAYPAQAKAPVVPAKK